MDLYNSYSPLRRSRSRKRTRPLGNAYDRAGAYSNQSGPSSYAGAYTTNVNGSQAAASMPDYLQRPASSVPLHLQRSIGPRVQNTQAAVDQAQQAYLQRDPQMVQLGHQEDMIGRMRGVLSQYQQRQPGIDYAPLGAVFTRQDIINGVPVDANGNPYPEQTTATLPQHYINGEPVDRHGNPYPEQTRINLSELNDYDQSRIDAAAGGSRAYLDGAAGGESLSRVIAQSKEDQTYNAYTPGNPGLAAKFGRNGAVQPMPQDSANTRSIVNPDYTPGGTEPKYLTFHRGGTAPRPQSSGYTLTSNQSGGNRESQIGGDFLARNYTGDGTAGPDGVYVMKRPDGQFAATSRGNLNRLDKNRNPLPPTTYEERRSMGTVRVDDEGTPIPPGGHGYDVDGNKQPYEDGHTVGAATLSMPHDYLDRAIAQSQRIKRNKEENGGLTSSQVRRLKTKQKTLDRSVRRGVLSQGAANKKLAQAADGMQRKVAGALNRGGARPATTRARVTLDGSYDNDFRDAREANDAALSAGATPEDREDLKRLKEIGRGVSGDETMLTSLGTDDYTPFGEAASTPEFDQWWQTQKPDEQHKTGRAFIRKAMNAYARIRDRNVNDPVLDSLSDVDLNDQDAVIDAMQRLQDHGRRKYRDRSWSKYAGGDGPDSPNRLRAHDLIGDTNPAWGIGGL